MIAIHFIVFLAIINRISSISQNQIFNKINEEHERNKRSDSNKDESKNRAVILPEDSILKVSGANNLFACVKETCIRVPEFSVSAKNTFNCYEKKIAITALYGNELFNGFLSQNKAIISDSQEVVQECKRFKKYEFTCSSQHLQYNI